jgi:hypothetical protein
MSITRNAALWSVTGSVMSDFMHANLDHELSDEEINGPGIKSRSRRRMRSNYYPQVHLITKWGRGA